jgi:hypothetical protein
MDSIRLLSSGGSWTIGEFDERWQVGYRKGGEVWIGTIISKLISI